MVDIKQQKIPYIFLATYDLCLETSVLNKDCRRRTPECCFKRHFHLKDNSKLMFGKGVP